MSWQNESREDRIIRFLVAIITGVLSYSVAGTARMVWAVVAAIALISSLSGFSLFYMLIGVSTQKRQK